MRGSNRDRQILVRGAAGNVGTCATQMAKEVGATVYGTAGAPGHRTCAGAGRRARLGRRPRWRAIRLAPLDAIIDTIGGDALESTCEALHRNGIIVSVV